MDIGFIGLGKMGSAMARNLAKADHRVLAWNRSPVDREHLAGVEIVASPAEAMQGDAVFTMLASDAAIREVLLSSGVLDQARAGIVHVVTATISVALSKELQADHERRGLGYVAAPVFGRPDVAEAAQLNVVVAGAGDAVGKVRPVLDALARKVWPLGTEPSQANAAKIAGNMMITMAIEAMAEAFVLTAHNGVASGAFLDLMLGTLFGGRAYETYGRKMVAADYEPGFRMVLGLKDLRLATEAADAAKAHLPMLEAVRERMAAAVEAGMGDRDWSGIADRPFSKPS